MKLYNLLSTKMISLKIILLLVLSGFSTIIVYFQIQITKLEENRHILEARIARIQAANQQPLKSPPLPAKETPTDNNIVVIYNRVPKTGSTSFVGVPYELCKKNKFHVLHINVTQNMHILSLPNQYNLVHNITKWDSIKPAIYHGHMAFLDFARLGAGEKPLYINIIRKPLDRLVSYYYFLRYGDNFRPYLVRRKHGDKMTFDECVENKQADCDPNNMWLQIPFFCGHAAECWIPGNEWALSEAKKNLLDHYLLVGVTEELEDFITILEATLPRLFKGASEYFANSNKTHLRKTSQKIHPSDKTIDIIQKSPIWQMENELYEFALEQFHFIKKRVLLGNGKISNAQKFMYEKIRPK